MTVKPSMLVTTWRRAVPYALLAALTFLAYGAALGNGYVWDDRTFLTDYAWVTNLHEALDASFAPLFGDGNYVRPLPLMMLHIEAIVTGRDPALSHGVNLLLHFGSSVLVYLLARRAARDCLQDKAGRWLPLLLACFFVVHPALSESVTWISSRFDLTTTFFMLLGVWFAGNDDLGDVSRAVAVGLCFFAAAFCKELAAVLPLVLGAYALLRGAAKRSNGLVQLGDAFTRREWTAYAAILILGAVYLAVRFDVLRGANLLKAPQPGPEEHVVLIGLALYKYVQLTFVPFIGNSPQHTFDWTEDSSLGMYWPQLLASAALIATAIGLAVRRRSAGWWLLAWLSGFLPVIHIVQLLIGSNLVHQRFMYFPTAVLLGFSPYVLSRIQLSALGRKVAIALSASIMAISVLVCWTIVPVWKSDLALWRWTVAMDPQSVQARQNLMWASLMNGMPDEVQKQWDYMIEHKMHPTAQAAVNMGVVYFDRGDFDKALHFYNLAYEDRGQVPQRHLSRLLSNLAAAHAVSGHASEAKRFIDDAVATDPTNTTALSILMAFCHKQEFDASAYRAIDLERARPGVKNAVELLMKHQAKMHEAGEFCPEHGAPKYGAYGGASWVGPNDPR